MKKSGFTLIELLAAIVVLGIIGLIVFPNVDKTIKNQKKKLSERQVSTIIEAAKGWGTKNTSYLPDEYGKTYVGMNALAMSGFLENNNVKDPSTSEKINGCVIIELDINYNQYKYEFINLAEKEDNKCDNDNICLVNNDGTTNCKCTKIEDTISCN